MKLKKLSALFLCSIIVFAFAGCGIWDNNSNLTPQEAIRDKYGYAEYTINFSSDGLKEPIDDIKYNAYNMPILPTPERVGYIFEGWYFDKNYTMPYTDGILYLYMSDVTLYAKWNKETLVTNGTYDIEFSCDMLSDTVVKSSLTDLYGFRNFGDDIIENETYIEKTENGTVLRIQFDCGAITYYGSGDVYTVNVSSRMGSSVTLQDKVSSDAETVKTYFFNIENFDLEDTLYLDICVTNWDTEGLTVEQRTLTKTWYTVAFQITRFIGFGKVYQDTSVPLEDGYYLVRANYKTESNEESMMQQYNPVFSYVMAKGGHYTLIKPFSPYSGLISSEEMSSNPIDDYYSRGMTFAPVQLYYEITVDSDKETSSSWLPSVYNAQYYGAYAVEFHADTGRFYSIYDLGDSLDKQFMINGSATGYMEMAGGMGGINMIMTVDKNSFIKLTGIDYAPLSGDSYEYSDTIQYYPGNLSDLNSNNTAYDAVIQSGLSTNLVNFFYSMGKSGTKMHSSRITVTPTKETNAKTVADSRYETAHFIVNTQIYGYSVEDELYADILQINSLGSYHSGGKSLRVNNRIRNGKSCIAGDTISLKDLYAEKVNAEEDFSSVTYKAYAVKNGKVDYLSSKSVSETFRFTDDIAIVFEYSDESSIRTSVVELVAYQEPVIKYSYDSAAQTYVVGQKVEYEDVSYTWMGAVGYFKSQYYAIEESPGVLYTGVNPMCVAVVKVENGAYSVDYTSGLSTEFEIKVGHTVVLYELQNPYGERYYFSLDYYVDSSVVRDYTVTLGENGDTVYASTVRYDEYGVRRQLNISSASNAATLEELKESVSNRYFLNIGLQAIELELNEFVIKTDIGGGGNVTYSAADNDFCSVLVQRLSGCRYAYVQAAYSDDYGDVYYVRYIYNLTFGGKTSLNAFGSDEVFTDYTYTVYCPQLVSKDGVAFDTGYFVLYYRTGNSYSSVFSNTTNLGNQATATIEDGQYKIVFHTAGEYKLTYNLWMLYDENGNHAFGDTEKTYLSVEQTVYVTDSNNTVTITYITDELHPFADGSTQYTVEYKLSDKINTLNKTYFGDTEDSLYAWKEKEEYTFLDKDKIIISGNVISDFVSSFGKSNVTLYAIWDAGIEVTLHMDYIDENGESVFEEAVYRYYLTKSGTNAGQYEISSTHMAEFKKRIPSYYGFICWTGGPYGNGTVTIVNPTTTESCVIVANIKRYYTVRFEVNGYYTNYTFWPNNKTVFDGTTLTDGAELMTSVPCYVEGYEFKGWYVQGDETNTMIDLETYIIHGDVTFVALFGPIGE